MSQYLVMAVEYFVLWAQAFTNGLLKVAANAAQEICEGAEYAKQASNGEVGARSRFDFFFRAGTSSTKISSSTNNRD